MRVALAILLFGLGHFSARAAFTSFYVFGDGLSAATTNLPAGPLYYGDRYANGRVWVELLAQQQGLTFYPSRNKSYFGNTSSDLAGEINSFNPTNASNALVVVWVNNADLYYPALDPSPTLAEFNAVINQAQTNHYKAITNLYARGIRTLVMPNVVDISTVPAFNKYTAYTNLFHQAATNYNVAFSATLNSVRTNSNYPGLTIYVPDFFVLLTNLLAHPANYGVTNALVNGLSTYALDAQNHGLPTANINGYGTNYIFWDDTDPTAMVHNWMASLAQQLISPVKISDITTLNGSNRLDLLNVPVGQNGLVLGRADLGVGSWATNASFISTNTIQSVLFPATESQGFYRLIFPVVWTWP